MRARDEMAAIAPSLSDKDSDAVVKTLKDNGAWDDLRQQVINQIRKQVSLLFIHQALVLQPELREMVIRSVAQSRALENTSAGTLGNRRLVEELTSDQETTDRVRKQVLKTIWKLTGSETEIGKQMKVWEHEALNSVYEQRNDEREARSKDASSRQRAW